MSLEELTLGVARRVVAVVVEPGLADRDRVEASERLECSRLRVAGLVRVDAENREDAVRGSAELRHLSPLLGPRAHLEDAIDARRARPLDELDGRIRARMQVRMRVDHAGAASAACSSRASSSSTTLAASSFLKSGRGSRSSRPGGSSLGAHEPTQVS